MIAKNGNGLHVCLFKFVLQGIVYRLKKHIDRQFFQYDAHKFLPGGMVFAGALAVAGGSDSVPDRQAYFA